MNKNYIRFYMFSIYCLLLCIVPLYSCEEKQVIYKDWSKEEIQKGWKNLPSELQIIPTDYWFYDQLKKHRCDNHQTLHIECSNSNCFCKANQPDKIDDIKATLLCAL